MEIPNPIHPDLLSPKERLAEACAILARGVVRLRLRNSRPDPATAESFAYATRPADAVMRTPTHEEEADA